MAEKTVDVVGVGNAIVDIIAGVEPEFLEANNIAKGTMTLVDQNRAAEIYQKFPPAREMSGGSAANTIASLANLGLNCGFMGKTADDQLGEVFAHDLRAIGVDYHTRPLRKGPSTAMSLIAVTPDADRSMNTFLGASVAFDIGDVDEALIERSEIIYLEGYLFDELHAKQAFKQAATYAVKHHTKVAMTLSDLFCVERHRDAFFDFITHHVDILFANRDEAPKLTGEEDIEQAAFALSNYCNIGAVTLSEHGAKCWIGSEQAIVPADPQTLVKDTTGAGDAFAAGFLYGLIKNKSAQACGQLGVLCAQEVISHYGARPEMDLKKIGAEYNLI